MYYLSQSDVYVPAYAVIEHPLFRNAVVQAVEEVILTLIHGRQFIGVSQW
jgi:hypothetical protein